MLDIIRFSAVSYISYKALSMFKKEYADIVGFICILYVGISICVKIGGWYNSFMDSAFMQLMFKIFG